MNFIWYIFLHLKYRALKAGCKSPLLVRPVDDSFEKAGSVALLAALHAVYVVSKSLRPCERPEKTHWIQCHKNNDYICNSENSVCTDFNVYIHIYTAIWLI